MRQEQPSKVWKEGILKAIREFKSGESQDQQKLHVQTAARFIKQNVMNTHNYSFLQHFLKTEE